jgi:hypothetical protein
MSFIESWKVKYGTCTRWLQAYVVVIVFSWSRTVVWFAFYSPPGEGLATYSLIISRLNYIRLGDPAELARSVVDLEIIIVMCPIPSA